MADYSEMYYALFNSITDAIELLKSAQAKAEELYIKSRAGVMPFKDDRRDRG